KLKWELVDLASLNGTLLNYKAVHHSQIGSRHRGDAVELTSRDTITLGTTSKLSSEFCNYYCNCGEFPVTITCSCSRITTTVPYDTRGNNNTSGYNADTALKAFAIQKLPEPLQPNEANGKRTSLGQRKLVCDDECSK
nr:NF-X1-type zinc finger protein NFXL1 [Tanacetum cinerariifolium]